MIKQKIKNKSAFTLAEVMIVFAIVAVISIFWIAIAKSKSNFATQVTYYAVVNNIKSGSDNLISEGYTNSLGKNQKTLPTKGYDSQNKTGICDRLVGLYNTLGNVDCSKTIASGTKNFSSETPNFTLTNGSVFYNVGSDALNISQAPTENDSTLDTATEKNTLITDRTNSKNALLNTEDKICTTGMYDYRNYFCSPLNDSCTNYKLTDLKDQALAAYQAFLTSYQQAIDQVATFIKAVITDAIKSAGSSYTVNNVNYVYQQVIANSTAVNTDTKNLNSFFDSYSTNADKSSWGAFGCRNAAFDDYSSCTNEVLLSQEETQLCQNSYDSTMANCDSYYRDGGKNDSDDAWAKAINLLNGTYITDIIAAATPYFASMPDKPLSADTTAQGYFDIFVDINGKSKGNSELNIDVFEFYLTRSGAIYPAKSSDAANKTSLAKARIYYKANANDTGLTILQTNLTYRQALCESNTVDQQLIDTLDYCSGYAIDTAHCPKDGNTCSVKLIKPGY